MTNRYHIAWPLMRSLNRSWEPAQSGLTMFLNKEKKKRFAGMLCFTELSLTAFCLLLLQIEDLGQPSTSKSVGTIFSIFFLGDSVTFW